MQSLLALIAFIILVISISFCHDIVCVKTDVIVSVGGCNRNGRCGVAYKSGRFGGEYMPAPGQTVCMAHEHVWRFPWN